MYEYDPTARMNRGNFRQKVGKGSASYAPMAKPLMATDQAPDMATQLGRFQSDGASAPPGQFAGQLAGTTQGESYSGKPDMSGNAQAYAKPLETNPSPSPMPQQGGAGWNDISRYQRPLRRESGGFNPNPPGASGIYDAASGLVPSGAGPVSRGVHRMADNGAGAALTRGILGGQSANNQRYAQTARAQRQSDEQVNQLRELMANGRTMEQALAETGLKGNAEWDESARVARPRATPRQMAGGGDRYGRYQP